MWIKYTQKTCFQSTLERLNEQSKYTPPIVKQLQLFLGIDGFIRCRGRFEHAHIPEETKYPILIPSNHYLAKFIVWNSHQMALHMGVSSTISKIREKYWIPRARQVVRPLLGRCVICKLVTGRPYSLPDPPPLPGFRVADVYPHVLE